MVSLVQATQVFEARALRFIDLKHELVCARCRALYYPASRRSSFQLAIGKPI